MRIRMLGPLEVRAADGTEVTVPGVRLRTLLAILALESGFVPAERLVEGIWGTRPPARPANALQALVSRLRRIVDVEAGPQEYRLVVDPDAVDVIRFSRLMADGFEQEALALWRGPALPDVRDNEFFSASVARLEELRLAALEECGSIPELTELAAANPLRESLVLALMRALAAAGRTAEALEVYERTRQALASGLGADPSPELSASHLDLLRGQPRTNLRAALTSFVGRDSDVAHVRKLLDEHRLVTLTGPGGCAKTRLCAEVARGLPGEVWLVELAALTSGDDVPQAILSAVGIRELSALRGRAALVVLDNCEHLIDAVAHLADKLLGECPEVRILATSREPLGITGEAVRQVEPLALPPDDASITAALAYPSVRLLVERAHPGFVPTQAVVQICRALDGIPLAIELAAARLRTMPAAQVAARLDDRFRLLTKGSRTALPRHRTLEAVIDWSWDLLSDRERQVLSRLAVFSGGATLDAAEHVCGPDAVDVLADLADKSLVIAGDQTRCQEAHLGRCDVQDLLDHPLPRRHSPAQRRAIQTEQTLGRFEVVQHTAPTLPTTADTAAGRR